MGAFLIEVYFLQAALDVLQMVVRGSKAPLSDALVQDCFPASVQCILQTEDNSTMQVRK